MVGPSVSKSCVGALVAVVTAFTIAGGAGGAATPRDPAKPAALCQFVSSAKDRNDKSAMNFDVGQARVSLGALRKAAKLSLPGELEDAIAQLIPLYTSLAGEGRRNAFTKLDTYATKHCHYKNAKDLDACTLVTHKDAEAVAGTPLLPATAFELGCVYGGAPGGPTANVNVFLGDKATQFLETDRRLAHEFVPVPDLGDEAYLEPVEPRTIFFRKSGIWIAIAVLNLADGDSPQVLQDVTRRIAASL